MALNTFKLEKLSIFVLKGKSSGGGAPTADAKPTFEAMFNPTSYSEAYALSWFTPPAQNGRTASPELRRSPPGTLKLNLILDGTGVDELGVASLGRASVSDRVKQFLDVAYNYQPELHEPNYLHVRWGSSLSFDCRLVSVNIKYTLFDRDGSPLRAELAIEFIKDDQTKKLADEDKTASPDLTHSRVVRSGDTLPLLTQQIYGSPDSYLDVARYNGLDDFRRLVPGTQLLFPPLTTFRSAAGPG